MGPGDALLLSRFCISGFVCGSSREKFLSHVQYSLQMSRDGDMYYEGHQSIIGLKSSACVGQKRSIPGQEIYRGEAFCEK